MPLTSTGSAKDARVRIQGVADQIKAAQSQIASVQRAKADALSTATKAMDALAKTQASAIKQIQAAIDRLLAANAKLLDRNRQAFVNQIRNSAAGMAAAASASMKAAPVPVQTMARQIMAAADSLQRQVGKTPLLRENPLCKAWA